MNLVDLGILFFILMGGIYGYRKGIFKTFIGLIGYGVSLLFSLIYYKQFGDFIDKLFGLSDKMIPQLKESINLPANLSTVQIKDLPIKELTSKINQFDMPSLYKQEMVDFLRKLTEQGTNPHVQNLGDAIISLIAVIIINGISVIILCMVIERLFHILGNILAKRKGFSFAEKVDKWVGAAIGGITNFIMAILLLIISTPIFAFGQSAASPESPIITIGNLVNNSTIVHFMFSIIQGLGLKL